MQNEKDREVNKTESNEILVEVVSSSRILDTVNFEDKNLDSQNVEVICQNVTILSPA